MPLEWGRERDVRGGLGLGRDEVMGNGPRPCRPWILWPGRAGVGGLWASWEQGLGLGSQTRRGESGCSTQNPCTHAGLWLGPQGG